MEATGRVENGVVVFDGDVTFPEGTKVTIAPCMPSKSKHAAKKKRVELPLVGSGEPVSIHLTNERINEILDEEDAESMKRFWGVWP